MWSWINSAVELVALYPGWALVIAFIAASTEAVAVLGVLIPGTPIVMAIAAAAAAAGQPMAPYLVLVAIGAIIGDIVSFWIGDRYRDTICRLWPLSRRPDLMESAQRFFARWGIYSVLFCRFFPVLRSTVPVVAGMAGMNRRHFVIANVSSALIWSPAHVYPGVVAGLTIERLNHGDHSAAALFGLGLVILCLGAWLAHRKLSARLR